MTREDRWEPESAQSTNRPSGQKRVVITGLGAVTPIGIGQKGLWEGVKRGVSAVQRVTRFDPGQFRSQVAAQVNDFDPQDWVHDGKKLRRLDRFSQFGLAAAMLALEDAGLNLKDAANPYSPEEVGCYIGTALGGITYAEEQHEIYMTDGIRAVSPLLALSIFGGAASCNIAIELGINGPNIANANSCASGTIALGEAFRVIKQGVARAMLAGGVEAPLAPLVYGSFSVIKAMSSANETPELACRPFDRNRDGFVMAEGSAILLLEEYESAVARNAPIYGEILGYGTTNDAYHMTAPLPGGSQATRSMRMALYEAGLSPAQVGYINAHASSTPLNDKTETQALKQVFGELAYHLPISGTKGLHGHALGATGAIEAAICSLIFRHNFLPPTTNLRDADPECDLAYIKDEGLNCKVDTILSNSFGFGGINAALVLGRV
ncbi:MAG: beta-ketoacyl-ACP synthase II [Chloroflexi bacterium]|nr:beta-ketoacyl-ACP synthase II [Chloroflexota bacterium]